MKYLFPILVLLTSCHLFTQPENKTLSLIILTDTIIGYQGNLTPQTPIKKMPVSETIVKEFIVSQLGNKKTTEILFKPEAMGDVGTNMQVLINWCKQIDFNNRRLVAMDSADKITFNLAGIPEETIDDMREGRPLHLNLPKSGDEPPPPEANDKTYTIFVMKNNMVYIFGGRDIHNKLIETTLTDPAVEKIIGEGLKKHKDDFNVIIKVSEQATYQNTVDVLDIMVTGKVKKYTVVELTNEEVSFIEGLPA